MGGSKARCLCHYVDWAFWLLLAQAGCMSWHSPNSWWCLCKARVKEWNLLCLKALILSVHLSYSRLIPHSHGKHFFSFLFVVLNSNISDRHLRHLLKTTFLLSFHHFKFSLLKYWEVRILTQASCAESKRMRDSRVPPPLMEF